MSTFNNPWASISIDGIKEAMQKVPAKVKKNDKYGQQLMASAKQWEDGSISITVSYKDEQDQWQRINIGKVMEGKGETLGGGAAPAAPSSGGFDSPF